MATGFWRSLTRRTDSIPSSSFRTWKAAGWSRPFASKQMCELETVPANFRGMDSVSVLRRALTRFCATRIIATLLDSRVPKKQGAGLGFPYRLGLGTGAFRTPTDSTGGLAAAESHPNRYACASTMSGAFLCLFQLGTVNVLILQAPKPERETRPIGIFWPAGLRIRA